MRGWKTKIAHCKYLKYFRWKTVRFSRVFFLFVGLFVCRLRAPPEPEECSPPLWPPRRSLHSRQTRCLFAARCTLTRRREIPRAHATSYRGAPPEPRKVTDERLTRGLGKMGREKTPVCRSYMQLKHKLLQRNCSKQFQRGGGEEAPKIFVLTPAAPPPLPGRIVRHSLFNSIKSSCAAAGKLWSSPTRDRTSYPDNCTGKLPQPMGAGTFPSLKLLRAGVERRLILEK